MASPAIFRAHPIAAFFETGGPFGSPERAVAGPRGFAPPVDVVEREGEYLVTVELPGLEEKDFQLEVHGNALTIAGDKRAEHEGERKGWRWSERAYGPIRRSIELPMDVAPDQASATFKNGVLAITLPKAEHARVRRIPVTTG